MGRSQWPILTGTQKKKERNDKPFTPLSYLA